eukprot:gene31986-4050_t
MSSTEAGKSPPAKRRRTVADVKVQTIMTQEEIDHLDSPVWTDDGMIGALDAIFGGLAPDPANPAPPISFQHYMSLK